MWQVLLGRRLPIESVVWESLVLASAILLAWVGILALRSVRQRQWLGRGHHAAAWLAWTLVAVAVAVKAGAMGHFPLASWQDSLLFWAETALLLLLVLEACRHWWVVEALGFPVVAAALAAAVFLPAQAADFQPFLGSHWLSLHAALNLTSYGAFALAFLAALLYLQQEKRLKQRRLTGWFHVLPPLEQLEWTIRHLITVGFVLMGLGIATGSIYARVAWGSYWSWNLKEAWTLLTWLFYAAGVGAVRLRRWPTRRVAEWGVAGFALILFNYFVVNLVWQSPHSLSHIPW
ncbi:MAG: cytochrome c biogenesis protein CcsA [Firmicutes bacterium]|nr:cytochrome c biogenesis protein CcsA [Bacillota bacterium]